MSRQTNAQRLIASLETQKADEVAQFERETETRRRVHLAELEILDRAIGNAKAEDAKRTAKEKAPAVMA